MAWGKRTGAEREVATSLYNAKHCRGIFLASGCTLISKLANVFLRVIFLSQPFGQEGQWQFLTQTIAAQLPISEPVYA